MGLAVGLAAPLAAGPAVGLAVGLAAPLAAGLAEESVTIKGVRIEVKDGMLLVPIPGRDLRSIDTGALFDVEVSPTRNNRTVGPHSQNNALMGYCRKIAAHHGGNSLEAVKRWVMQRAAEEIAYPMEEMPDGRMVPKSSREATVGEFSLLITMSEVIMHEEGIERD